MTFFLQERVSLAQYNKTLFILLDLNELGGELLLQLALLLYLNQTRDELYLLCSSAFLLYAFVIFTHWLA